MEAMSLSHSLTSLKSFRSSSPSASSSSPPTDGPGLGSARPNTSGSDDEDDDDDDEEDDDDVDASIFSSLAEVLSGEGGSCSVPGSMRDESRVSVSDVLLGVNASAGSAFCSEQETSAEEVEAGQTPLTRAALVVVLLLLHSAGRSPSPLTRRRFTGVAPSSSTERQTHTHGYLG